MTTTTENKIKQGYKQTVVGVMPDDWKIQKMKEIGGFYRGKGIPKKDLEEEGLNAIRYGEIYTVHHYFIKEFYSFINKETANDSFLLNKGDLLFTGSGETLEDIGKSVAFIGDEKAYAGGDIVILRPKENTYNSKFLGFLTNNEVFRRQTYRAGQGQSVVHIYPSNLEKIKLPIPPLPEQKAIADCLSTWDKGIEKLSALIASKKEQKKGLMQQLLTGKKRLDGFREEWNASKLEKWITLGNGRDYKHLKKGDIPVHGTGGVIAFVNDYLFDGFSIGIGRKGTIDKPVLLQGKFWTIDTLFFVKEFKDSDPYFMFSLFQTIPWLSFNQASGLPSLSQKIINEIKVKIPSIKEQTAIAEILTSADKEIDLLQKKLSTFKTQKKGLMQVLLTGALRLGSGAED